MRIRIESDGHAKDLTDLQAWLRRDPDARRLPVAPVTTPGSTMGALDALDVVFSHGLDIANFAVAYASWRTARGSTGARGARTLTHGSTTVDISHLSVAELTELLRGLENGSSDTGTPRS
ncbi:hypothetical protein [Streptomyces sp. NPDC046805]|uniref:effector-associated constant component EACC1 n=1 Tax=Streptomyces sp. NPDC046805 TaxID=3155134 RepID=UPI0033FB320F